MEPDKTDNLVEPDKTDNLVEPDKTASLPFVALAATILALSASLFLSDLSFSRKLFPLMFEGYRIWGVIFESFFAYLIGSLSIATQSRNLNTVNWKKVINWLLIAGIVLIMISIGLKGSSFGYLNISSFTIIVLALMYYTINPKEAYLNNSALFTIGLSFFVLAFLVMNPNCDTSLREVSIVGVEQSGEDIHLDIETIICQEKTHATNICIEMISLEGTIEKNAEYIKVVDFLEKDGESIQYWCVKLPAKNVEYALYLRIWSELGETQYRVKIPKDIKVGDFLSYEKLTQIDYLRIYIFKLKRYLDEDLSSTIIS